MSSGSETAFNYSLSQKDIVFNMILCITPGAAVRNTNRFPPCVSGSGLILISIPKNNTEP